MATCTVRVSSNLSGVQCAGVDALKLSEVLGECAQDVIAVPLPKASRRIHASLCLLVLVLASGAFAQDPNSIYCNGLAGQSPNAINLPLHPKVDLDVFQECPAGTAMRAISFSHKKDENLTFQESFALQCATSQSVVTTQCSWGSFTSNFNLSTKATAPPGSVITGVRFTHKKDENFTHQQSFAIKSCSLQNPQPLVNQPNPDAGSTTKWHLESNASCDKTFGSGSNSLRLGLANSLGFSHTKGYNNTSEESVQLGCVLN
jgi:hypothetical protein